MAINQYNSSLILILYSNNEEQSHVRYLDANSGSCVKINSKSGILKLQSALDAYCLGEMLMNSVCFGVLDVAKAVFNDFKDSFTGADDSKEYNGGRKKSHKGRKAKSTTHLPPSKRTLRIYGLSASSVSSAISDIQQHCKETKLEAVLESAPVKEAISKLTADQVSWLYY